MARPSLRSLLLLLTLALAACCGDPEDATVGINAPLQVVAGEEFTIEAWVQNTSDTPRTLASLDIDDEYLAGVVIRSAEPAYGSASHVAVDNTMSYVFGQPIGAKEKRSIILRAVGVKPGDYSGEVDFCIDSDYKFLSFPVRTLVVSKP